MVLDVKNVYRYVISIMNTFDNVIILSIKNVIPKPLYNSLLIRQKGRDNNVIT